MLAPVVRPKLCIQAGTTAPAIWAPPSAARFAAPVARLRHDRSRQGLLINTIGRGLAQLIRTMSVLVLALVISSPLPSIPAYAATGSATVTEAGLPSIVQMPDLGASPRAIRRQKTSFVTAAVETVGPAVVRIDTERLVDRQPIEGYLFPGLEPDGQRRESGQGSGVILSEEGLILTNAHVVKNAAKVTVTLTDGRTFEGVVKGQDDYMDLAAVKIKPAGRRLPIAPLGQSDDLQVGDWVIAIGNAVGLDSTVTLGIVSSLSRSAAEVGIPNKKVNFIQTDAAINPGNEAERHGTRPRLRGMHASLPCWPRPRPHGPTTGSVPRNRRQLGWSTAQRVWRGHRHQHGDPCECRRHRLRHPD